MHTALTSHRDTSAKDYDPSAHGLVFKIKFYENFIFDFVTLKYFIKILVDWNLEIIKKKLGKYSIGYLSVCSGR